MATCGRPCEAFSRKCQARKHRVIHTKLQIFQLNIRKRDVAQLGIMNDQDLQQYAVQAVAEPHWMAQNRHLTYRRYGRRLSSP